LVAAAVTLATSCLCALCPSRQLRTAGSGGVVTVTFRLDFPDPGAIGPVANRPEGFGGTLVGEGRQGFFETALGKPWFYLGPTPSWQSGAADCTAYLEQSTNKGWSVLGSTPSFHVYE
jgi:hypothetical protein